MALKSFRITVNVPGELEEIVGERMQEERYHSLSSYCVGLILFDIFCRRPHRLTAPLMREPQYVRDRVIAEMVEAYKKGGTGVPGWFEKQIAELVEQAKLNPPPPADPKENTKDDTADGGGGETKPE